MSRWSESRQLPRNFLVTSWRLPRNICYGELRGNWPQWNMSFTAVKTIRELSYLATTVVRCRTKRQIITTWAASRLWASVTSHWLNHAHSALWSLISSIRHLRTSSVCSTVESLYVPQHYTALQSADKTTHRPMLYDSNWTRSSATAKSTARPSCLVGVLYQKLEGLSYQMLKTARLYLHSSGHNNGTWRTDRRTDRRTDGRNPSS